MPLSGLRRLLIKISAHVHNLHLEDPSRFEFFTFSPNSRDDFFYVASVSLSVSLSAFWPLSTVENGKLVVYVIRIRVFLHLSAMPCYARMCVCVCVCALVSVYRLKQTSIVNGEEVICSVPNTIRPQICWLLYVKCYYTLAKKNHSH